MLTKRLVIRVIYILALTFAIAATVGIGIILQSKTHIFSQANTLIIEDGQLEPFPVSVNQYTQVITEDPEVEQFFIDTLAQAPESKYNWWNQVASVLSSHDWYQNLASPVSRIVVIWPGERKEEITKNISDVLRWDEGNRTEFKRLIDSELPILAEGKYYPGQYVAHRNATPVDVHQLINTKFKTEVLSRYTPEVEANVSLEDALIIASLLEREASDFQNMREVSGVIWNRLFINMPLQLDATLQYVKGSSKFEPKWWPVVKPRDKYLDSPFNTYKNSGLPPAPIANPSTEAILAALNPVITNCLFYFHTENGDYHCSENYSEHVDKLRAIYGRGS